MKKETIVGLVALLAISTFVLPSHAAWDARFFPTPVSPSRKGGVVASEVIVRQMYEALCERSWAKQKDSGYCQRIPVEQAIRFPERSLVEIKNELRSLIPYFINQYATESNEEGVLDANTIVMWDERDLMAHLGVVSNYFVGYDYEYYLGEIIVIRKNQQPSRNLMGNMEDIEGKAHLEAGRDYGWHPLYLMFNELVYTLEPGGILVQSYNRLEQIGLEEWDGPSPPPPGLSNCYLDDDNTVIPVEGLTLADFSVVQRWTEFYNITLLLRTLPQDYDSAAYTIYNRQADLGILAAYVGADDTVLTNSHQAWAWYRETGTVDANWPPGDPRLFDPPCGSGQTNLFLETSGSQQFTGSDGTIYVVTGVAQVLESECRASGIFASYEPIAEGGGFYDNECGGQGFSSGQSGPGHMIDIRSTREYSHVVRWGFNYK